MSNAEFLKMLEKMGVCSPEKDYFRDKKLSLSEAWAQHKHGHDMARLLAHLVNRRRLALILADVLEPAIASLPGNQRRGAEVDILRKWGRGEATDKQMLDARVASYCAVRDCTDDYRAAAAAYAAHAAYRAATVDIDSAAGVYASSASAYANAAYCAACLGVGVPAIIRRHVSPEEIVALARAYMEKNK